MKQHRLGGQEARGLGGFGTVCCWGALLLVRQHTSACVWRGGGWARAEGGGWAGVGELCKQCSGMARGRYAPAEPGLRTAMG